MVENIAVLRSIQNAGVGEIIPKALIIQDINVRRSNIHFNRQRLKVYRRSSDSNKEEER